MKFNIGDCVKVTSVGQCYSTYADFFEENGIDREICARYAYGRSIGELENVENKTFRIVEYGKHKHGDNLYIIAEDECSEYFLMNEKGIDYLKKKMTLEAIESLLGYRIELIE